MSCSLCSSSVLHQHSFLLQNTSINSNKFVSMCHFQLKFYKPLIRYLQTNWVVKLDLHNNTILELLLFQAWYLSLVLYVKVRQTVEQQAFVKVWFVCF